MTRWLVRTGASVTVTDRADGDQLSESLAEIGDLDLDLRLGGHDPADLSAIDLVVVNPAVRKAESDLFQEIVRRDVPWTTEMNLFCERCGAPIVAVTGSYGKSTTCAMLADALTTGVVAKRIEYTGVHLGGNIGGSLLTDLPNIKPTDLVVLEMSDAQLEDVPRIRWAPKIAVITNLSPHHLDRYNSYGEYISAKLNVIGAPPHADTVVAGDLDAETETALARALSEKAERIIRIEKPEPAVELRVPGRHNLDNAACVLSVCRLLSLDETIARSALAEFKGLPHRLEFVRTIEGVDYYNDSKSTAPAATVKAIASFDRPIVAIVGGQRKDVPLDDWANALTQSCHTIICTGESGKVFGDALRQAGDSRSIQEANSLADALHSAKTAAQPGDIVLFSPGAPSFDNYPNFVARGLHFVELVNGL